MSLSEMRPALLATVRSASSRSLFGSARAHHALLRAYPGLATVLAELAGSASEAYPLRDSLTRVLIVEAQRTHHEVWSAALVLAYLPMLIRLRRRLRSSELGEPDLDQLVLSSFLQAVASFPLARRTDRAPMRLRQTTQRAVFATLRREQRARRERIDLERTIARAEPFDPFAETPSGDEPNEEETHELERLLAAHLAQNGDLADFELIRRTTLGGERICEVARSLAPNASPELERRLYNRLKRRRERALRRVGARLGRLTGRAGAER